jgi:hypothetical protein
MIEDILWSALATTFRLICWCGAAAFIIWVLAILWSICFTNWQPKRRGNHRVGGVWK